MHTFRRARFLKSPRYIPLCSQEDPELVVYTFRRARFLDPKRARGAYLYAPAPRIELSRMERARGAYLYAPAPRIECPGWKELEVHTSTLPGGSRARGVYLQKSSLPEELEVHTSTLSGGSTLPRCKPLQELEVYTFRRAPKMERARGAYLELPGSRCICLCCHGSDKRTLDTKPDPHVCRSKLEDGYPR